MAVSEASSSNRSLAALAVISGGMTSIKIAFIDICLERSRVPDLVQTGKLAYVFGMKRSLFFVVLGFLLLFAAGLYTGYRLSDRPPEREVNADVILTALRDSGFLVTQTYVFDQPITITKSSGSALKDFFFGQTITARGVMEVNLGVDLSDVSEEDVEISENGIVVSIPAAKVFTVRPIGDLQVDNQQGILKRLFEDDPGYNEALAELTRVAEEAATDPELLDRASRRAEDEIGRFLRYVAEGREVEVRAQMPEEDVAVASVAWAPAL